MLARTTLEIETHFMTEMFNLQVGITDEQSLYRMCQMLLKFLIVLLPHAAACGR